MHEFDEIPEGGKALAQRHEDEQLLNDMRKQREAAEKAAELHRIELRRAERVVAACSAAIDQLETLDKQDAVQSLQSSSVRY